MCDEKAGEGALLATVHEAVETGQVKLSLHALGEAVADGITRSDILEALADAHVLEDYPDWWLGPCCLLYGVTWGGRDLHIVVSYDGLPVTIITTYEPRPPTWATPTRRGGAA